MVRPTRVKRALQNAQRRPLPLVVAHVVFGALQTERSTAWTGIVAVSVLLIGGLHAHRGRIRSTHISSKTGSTDTLRGKEGGSAG